MQENMGRAHIRQDRHSVCGSVAEILKRHLLQCLNLDLWRGHSGGGGPGKEGGSRPPFGFHRFLLTTRLWSFGLGNRKRHENQKQHQDLLPYNCKIQQRKTWQKKINTLSVQTYATTRRPQNHIKGEGLLGKNHKDIRGDTCRNPTAGYQTVHVGRKPEEKKFVYYIWCVHVRAKEKSVS